MKKRVERRKEEREIGEGLEKIWSCRVVFSWSLTSYLYTVYRRTLRRRDTTCRCDNHPHTNGSRISDLGCISSRSCTPPYKRRCDTVHRTNTPNPCTYTAFIRSNTHRHIRLCPAVGIHSIMTDKCNRNQSVYLRLARRLARR